MGKSSRKVDYVIAIAASVSIPLLVLVVAVLDKVFNVPLP